MRYLQHEFALFGEEIRIKDAHMAPIPAQRRPYYPPVERMAVLELRAARGWSLQQTAEMFLDQPGLLILLSAVIGIFGTVMYSVGLILLNHFVLRRQLTPSLRSSRWSLLVLVAVSVCYLALAAGYLVVKFSDS